MPFGKDKGFCNQGGELMRVHEENALLRARVAELEADLLKSHREGDELVRRWKDAVSVIRLLAPCLSGIGDQEREALAAAHPYLPE